MFTSIFAVSRKHENKTIFTRIPQRIRQFLLDLINPFILHLYVPQRNKTCVSAEIFATYNARVTGIFSPILYI